jgi:hypothetical protein
LALKALAMAGPAMAPPEKLSGNTNAARQTAASVAMGDGGCETGCEVGTGIGRSAEEEDPFRIKRLAAAANRLLGRRLRT